MSSEWTLTDFVAAWGAVISTTLAAKEIWIFLNHGPKLKLTVQGSKKDPRRITLIVTNTGDQPCTTLAVEVRHLRRRFGFSRTIETARFDSSTPFSPIRALEPGGVVEWPLNLFNAFKEADGSKHLIQLSVFHDRSRGPTSVQWRKLKA